MRSKIVKHIIPGLALLFGLGIATSTALMSASSLLLMLSSLVIRDFRAKLTQSFRNKFILSSCLFYCLFIVACLWSNAGLAQSFKMLSRLVAYGAAPLLFVAIYEGEAAKLLLKGFVIGAVLSALCSILAWMFQHPILQGTSDGLTDGALFKWTIFRGHLLHDAFLAIAASFILAGLVYAHNLSRTAKLLWLVAYLICLLDAMFLVQGRTGQIMFLAMNAVVVVCRFKFKGLLYAALAALVILPLLLWTAPALKNGVNEFKTEQVALSQGNYNTSSGLRHQFHSVSLQLIKQRPLFGYGTGSFATNYAQQVATTNFIRTKNPHGDLYLIGVELGLLGLLGFGLLILANCCELYQGSRTPLVDRLVSMGERLKSQNRFDSVSNNSANSHSANMYRGMGFSLLSGYLIALTQNSFFMDNVTGLAYLLLMISILVLILKAKHD